MTEVDPNTIHRVSHEIKRRRLQVLRVEDLTPRMRRITVGGPELAGFASLGTDDHVKLLFPQNAEEHAALENFSPSIDKAQGPMPQMRDYTPRRYDLDTLELDIDFVLHGDGPAATWAAQATPGQYLYIAGPRGSMIVPDIFDSYLLIGDETALPAIARRLEGLASNRRALVVVEVENGAEQQILQSPAQVHVIWVLREGRQDNLLRTVQQLDMPGGKLYAWVATESKVSRQIRKVLLEEKGLDQDFVKAVGYWKLDDSEED
ncbi:MULTISPECIES: siderophore-interacting protein [Pseudomonas]|uniref:siderophore-interacting protein n=1 Tax=Pseudomonas TaxID=286 RepID=UPI000415F4E1|nr:MULTISPECIES: siderophore-interacting protein [Pseudomonas]MCP1457735.1 NADPH-dependent ferric siderophore reductase [Pseudomonas kilonensis]UVM60327.1 siderophore-interacting protein [Pseudomonas sp. B21-010]WPN62421.1 siderophore-interacting protein [Pseudomonas sp. P9_32]WPN68175.1 siderophore-interacting protein [Pseudomonas sp. P9_35]